MNAKAKIFDSLLATFENEDIKNFAKECIETIPDYFWKVGASSTGKYHPEYALGDLGLARHTCALVRFLNHFFSVDCYRNDFTSRERDLLRVAGIMHDSRKSGNDDDFLKNKFTRFTHPLLAANEIRAIIGFIPPEEVEFVATAIESHMGQWCTDKRSNEVLPLPKNKYQKILHLADYLASRKDIEVLFKDEEKAAPLDINTYVMPFGKYKGRTLPEIASVDNGYISWAKENMTREPVKTLLAQI